MWKPKYLDHQILAQDIADFYGEIIKNPDAIKMTADEFGMSLTSVYRYLKYAGVELPKRKRDKRGRFTT